MAAKIKYVSQHAENAPQELQVYINGHNQLVVLVSNTLHNNYEFVALDKDTAIKFAKEVRKQISFLED